MYMHSYNYLTDVSPKRRNRSHTISRFVSNSVLWLNFQRYFLASILPPDAAPHRTGGESFSARDNERSAILLPI